MSIWSTRKCGTSSKCEGHLGKFDSCRDEALFSAALDASSDTIGESDYGMWSTPITCERPEIIATMPGSDHLIMVPAGFYLVCSDDRGFVWVNEYDTAAALDAECKARAADYEGWYSANEIDA